MHFLIVDQARSCDPTMVPDLNLDQLDVMDGVSLIEGLQMDIVNTSLLRVATKM